MLRAMHEEPTTVIIQRCLDALPGGTAAELDRPRPAGTGGRPVTPVVRHAPVQELPAAYTAAREPGDG